jgi:hypothetical protein
MYAEKCSARSLQKCLRLQKLHELGDLFQMVVERPERKIADIDLSLAVQEVAEHEFAEHKCLGIEAGDLPEVIGSGFDGIATCEKPARGIVQGSLALWIIAPRTEILQLTPL